MKNKLCKILFIPQIIVCFCFPTYAHAADKCPDTLVKVNSELQMPAPMSGKVDLKKAKDFLKSFPAVEKQTTSLLEYALKAVNGEISLQDPKLKQLVLEVGGLLHNTGYLPSLIRLTGKTAFKAGKLPSFVTLDSLDRNLNLIIGIVEAELMARGYTQESKGIEYEEWATLGRRINRETREIVKKHQENNKIQNLFESPNFLKDFQRETGTEIKSGSEVELLVNGPASFAKKDQMLQSAKEKIYIGSWAWYDDVTGAMYAKKLIEKKKSTPDIDIKIMVDGQTANNPKMQKHLKEMEDAGIEVLRWFSTNPQRPYDGYHKKLMVVDGDETAMGGMNFGDEYSHLGPTEVKKWRDTDLYIRGQGSRDVEALFIKDWNEQLAGKSRGTIDKKLTEAKVSLKPTSSDGPFKTALTNHVPGAQANIYRSIILAIQAAKTRVDIENAYVLLDPGTYQALLEAKKRGVKIRILTNSEESVDVPEMSYMMMRSANRLAKAGFEVYIKRGATLHTKALVVDNTYSWVGSHNLHGRSYRYEGEMTMAVFDPKFGKQMVEMIDEDCKAENATHLTKPIPIKPNPLSEALGYWIFDQL